MEYVGRKVTKNAGGRGSCFGSVESYTPATGLFKVVYDDGNSEEITLAEVSPLLTPADFDLNIVAGNPPADFDLNVAGNPPAEFDLNVAASPPPAGGAEPEGLHGLDLNEGVNYILHEEDLNSNPKRKLIDLNSEAAADEEEAENRSSPKRVKSFDLNVDLKEDRPTTAAAATGRVTIGESSLRRQFLQNYGMFAGRPGPGVYYNQFPSFQMQTTTAPPNSPPLYPLPRPRPVPAPLPPSSAAAFNLEGASLLDFLSVYSFLRSFSVSLFISPFEIQELASSLISNDSTSSLFDSIHLSLLAILRRHLMSLSEEGSASASLCLRSLNWDLLDSITWPMFLFEYLVFHSPKYIPGMDKLDKECKYKPFECEYYTMPASAKIAILQHLCDEVVETEACRSEINRRGAMAESNNWNSRYFSCKLKKADCTVEEYTNEFTDDGNGDECYLCRTEGNLICCDGCPAAYHARCVGISTSLLPEGDWYCPECAIDKTNPHHRFTKSVRGLELLGTDPHGRLYYTCCQYLLVSDSCNDEFSFLLYKGDDVAAVVTALESSSSHLHARLISAIRAQWRSADEAAAAGIDEGSKMENPIILESPEISQQPADENEISDDSQNKGDLGDGSLQQPPTIINQTTVGSTANDDGGAAAGEPSSSRDTSADEPCFVNMYEFGRTACSLSKQFSISKAEDAATARQSMALQMRAISNQYASTTWSNLQNLNPDSRKEKCGWCAGCKLPEGDDQVQCLFLRIDHRFRAPAENFTSGALGIRATGNKKKHLIDVICHVIWMEDRLRGLLSGPWTSPRFSTSWRSIGFEAAHIGYVKKMLLQLELNIHRRALSADWTKNADSAVTMGSASHIVRKQSSTRAKPDTNRSKRKCSRQGVTQTPNDAIGESLSWWRGGKASRHLFHWKVLPRSSVSKAARQGGCNKIAGVNYPDSGEYAKRIRFTAWRAAVGAAKTVDQLALQIRVLDASIKWNEVGNINLLPEREPKKPIKSFKTAVIRRQRREGEKVTYLLDFGKSRLIPNLVVKHGSLQVEDGSSTRNRKKYWLEESHVPLHLLKAYNEKRLLRAATRDAATELHDSSNEQGVVTERNKGFEYLFERAERLEFERTTTCEHCSETVLLREAVTCKYCNGFFHSSHAKESSSTSTAEATYTCHKCWERNEERALMETAEVQRRRRATVPEQDLWDAVATMPKKRRTVMNSSYWVNGVHLSRNGDDERLLQYQRTTLRLIPGEDAPINEDPRCILCDETERAANLNYVSCEICGDWFHGDALDLSDDRMELIIGFECHKCLNKRPPVCPHWRPAEDAVPSEESGSEVGDFDYSHDSEETSSV